MEKEIKVFENAQFGQVRSITMGESKKPWFAAMDVCKSLDLKNTSVALSRLDEDEVTKLNLGGLQGETNFVNEYGLYSLILASRKPEAKKFKRWITHEVIPSIINDGGYLASREGETDDEIIARALRLANKRIEEQAKQLESQTNTIKSLGETIRLNTQLMNISKARQDELEERTKAQQERLEKAAPKVRYHDQVLQSTSTYTATQIAKEFGWGAERLNKKLHEMGVQYKQNGQWLLYSNYCGKGYTKSLTYMYMDVDGVQHSRQSTVWTELGRKMIHEKIGGAQYVK